MDTLLEQIRYIRSKVPGFWKVPGTMEYYNLISRPYLHLASEHESEATWDDEPKNYIVLEAYKDGNMLTEIALGKELEIFVTTYKIRLKVDEDEIESLGHARDNLYGLYIMNRQSLNFEIGRRTIEQVIEMIDNCK